MKKEKGTVNDHVVDVRGRKSMAPKVAGGSVALVVDRETDRVLGLHMVGPDAPEIVQAAAIAITMGATKADLDRTFALHPTTAEELVLMR